MNRPRNPPKVLLTLNALTSETEALDQRSVTPYILASDVVQQPAPPGNHRLQPAPAGRVLLVNLEMLREMTDTLRQNRYLHLWRTRVAVVLPRFNH